MEHIQVKDKNKKTLPKFVTLAMLSTGGWIRTPINGFGDRYSTLELHPYFKKVLSIETQNFLY